MRIAWAWFLLFFSMSLMAQKPAEKPVKEASGSLKEFRILSISQSAGLILISDPSTKTRYLLEASKAKILIDGKESDLKSLQAYGSAQVSLNLAKQDAQGISLDGTALRIEISTKK